MKRKSSKKTDHTATEKSQAVKVDRPSTLFPVVGVGASAGGLEAFSLLLKHLPTDTGMALVLVQHLDPTHESALTQLLSRITRMPVVEVTQNLRVAPNHVYIIPRNKSMRILKGVLQLQPRQKESGPHLPINFFLESLAQDQHERAIGVILSGTASDGTLGLEAIKAEGGIAFAQDESAKYDSMPRSAIAAGCVDFILSPEKIAAELARVARHPYVLNAFGEPSIPDADREIVQGEDGEKHRGENGYGKILTLLRNHSGVEFSLYKPSTLQRRVARRVVLNKLETLDAYAKFLRGNDKELDMLYSDVLISVTSFFRNPEAYATLKSVVFPKLCIKSRGETVRVWVLGCSTGQEAYSIAMSFLEFTEHGKLPQKMQVFATDLNESSLEKARRGLYPKTLELEMSAERLRRFFVDEDGGYRISKTLREMCVFARQNLISDPPFSRMDLISCRNMLIYLEPSVQHKAIPTFHYALKPEGYLFLGASESVGHFTELFESIDKKHKIYRRKGGRAPAINQHFPPAHAAKQMAKEVALPTRTASSAGFPTEINAQREADRVTVNKYAPPAVLINAEMQILQFRGSTSAYLEPPMGKANFNVLKMARQGLMLPLRAAIGKAKKENITVRRQNIRLGQSRESQLVNIEIIPLKNLKERCYLVFFENARQAHDVPTETIATPAGKSRRVDGSPGPVVPTAAEKREKSRRLAELERELAESRDYTQSVEQQYEAANEELQASGEEVQSANEELQSINEELETSKEELESNNEELTTVNEEMANRNVELTGLNNDLTNFHASVNMAMVLLARDLTIRRFTAQAAKSFNLQSTDIGRFIGNIKHNLDLSDLEQMLAEVIDTVSVREREVKNKDGQWFSLRVRPYMTLEKKIDGAVLVLVDIDGLKRTEEAQRHSEMRYRRLFEAASDGIIMLDPGTNKITEANPYILKFLGYTKQELLGKELFEIGLLKDEKTNASAFQELKLKRHIRYENLPLKTKAGELREVEFVSSCYQENGREVIQCNVRDVTERKRAEESLREVDRRKDEFLAMLAHELRNPLAPIKSMADVLRLRKIDDPVIVKVQQILERQVDHMIRLLDDLLDTSRIQQRKVTLRKQFVNLARSVLEVLDAAHDSIQQYHHSVKVDVKNEPHLLIEVDPARLTQIINNLIANAVKYTPRGGTIHVSVSRGEGNMAVLRVRDNGIGIERHMLKDIFELFVQAQNSLESAQGGLGLGLKLVKELVEMQGGTVEARSEGKGKGSEFIVCFPEAYDACSMVQAQNDVLPGPSRRVLLIDDNIDILESIELMLNMSGHSVELAETGTKGLEKALRGNFDLALVDIGLPEMNGYEVAKKIREHRGSDGMVLIAMTGFGQMKDKDLAREAGFDDHLTKPVSSKVLLNILNGLEKYGEP